jgi:hypothetical protein
MSETNHLNVLLLVIYKAELWLLVVGTHKTRKLNFKYFLSFYIVRNLTIGDNSPSTAAWPVHFLTKLNAKKLLHENNFNTRVWYEFQLWASVPIVGQQLYRGNHESYGFEILPHKGTKS